MKIIKRSGQEVEYSLEKIQTAITKANNSLCFALAEPHAC